MAMPSNQNIYTHCGKVWEISGDSPCNDGCPKCGKEISPIMSFELLDGEEGDLLFSAEGRVIEASDRELLERAALSACHPDLVYELRDSLEETPDVDLVSIVRGSAGFDG